LGLFGVGSRRGFGRLVVVLANAVLAHEAKNDTTLYSYAQPGYSVAVGSIVRGRSS